VPFILQCGAVYGLGPGEYEWVLYLHHLTVPARGTVTIQPGAIAEIEANQPPPGRSDRAVGVRTPMPHSLVIKCVGTTASSAKARYSVPGYSSRARERTQSGTRGRV
jgi:hypothetical protein